MSRSTKEHYLVFEIEQRREYDREEPILSFIESDAAAAYVANMKPPAGCHYEVRPIKRGD